MQDDRGLKKILSNWRTYEGFQNLVGARRFRRWMAENYWRLKGEERVVDVGCGPGVVLEHLPARVEYVGFDINEEYVQAARRRFGHRAIFLTGRVEDFSISSDIRMRDADLVMCNGLLHHLDDAEATKVLQFVLAVLKPGGRFVAFEPVYLAHQGRLSKWTISRDRGKNVRCEAEWKKLVGCVFQDSRTNIVTGLLHIPYVHIVIEASKPCTVHE